MKNWRFLPFLLCFVSILGLTGLAGCGITGNSTSTPAIGVLEGKVSIVSRSLDGIDQPYPPEVYQSRKVMVYTVDRTTLIRQVDIDEYGYYRVELSPGTYVIDINYYQGDTSDAVPRKLKIEAGVSYMFDTGFRTELVSSMPEGTALNLAKPYRVRSEGKLAYQGDNRTVGLWYITSPEASGFEEYAQTAAQAALDLYELYHRAFTSVLLVPREGILLNYAQANFATDGKGAEGMTGDAPAKPMTWIVRASGRILTEQELSIAELWTAKQEDFPSKNSLSSLSYDKEALQQHITDTLNIPLEEALMPHLQLRQYHLSQAFMDKTISLAAAGLPNNPKTEVAINSLQVSGSLSDIDKNTIGSLVSKIPHDIQDLFTHKYELALGAAKDPMLMIYSSWRPYTKSNEYQELLAFCCEQGKAAWPLMLQCLGSENRSFAGGLILDTTLPEYLYYLEKSYRVADDRSFSDDMALIAYFREILTLVQEGK